MDQLISTLTNAAQLIDDIEIREPKAMTEWGRGVRGQISQRLAELYKSDSTEVAKYAYETMLRGFSKPQDEKNFMPEWEHAPAWVRDLAKVAALAGGLRHETMFPQINT